MPTITSLDKIKRLKGWYELWLDGIVSFPVNDELILKYLLKTGRTLSSSEIKSIREQGEYLFLKKKALDILARRRLSEKELRRKLRPVNKVSTYIERLMNDLKKHGLIDDRDFAAAVIHTQLIGGSKSKRYIKSKLYQKGVPKTISEEAVETELADYNEAEAAMKIARKKYKTVKDLPQLKAKKRIADFLRGRGFDWDIVNQALDELFKGDD
jgi:regulatory protein